MKTEQAIERYLCRRVKEQGGMCVKLVGWNGIPDRLVILPDGRNIFVELKQVDGRLSAIQMAVHRRLHSMKQIVYVLWTFEDVDVFMDEIMSEVSNDV